MGLPSSSAREARNRGIILDHYILYGTSACHLCEVAEEMLLELRESGCALNYEKCDIAGSDQLFERYGLRIPVLLHPDGSELGWPFDADRLRQFVSN